MVERVPTGIPELDDMLAGGIPDKSSVLVKGPPGSFKTILCLQYLYSAAKSKKEPGLYVTFNQSIDGVLKQAAEFGWNFKGLPVQFVAFDTSKDFDVEPNVVMKIKESGAKRLVIDSLSSYLSRLPVAREDFEADQLYDTLKRIPGLAISEDMLVRALTTRLLRRIAGAQTTSMFIYEDLTLENVRQTCEYLMDGVIRLNRVESIGKRTITVEKMRYTKHDFLPRNNMLTESGLKIEK